jgi:hypothetical protein
VGISPDVFPTASGGRAEAARAAAQRSWIPATALANELGVSRRTLARWLGDSRVRFPRPRVVNHRLYFERSAVETWKAATIIKAASNKPGSPIEAIARDAAVTVSIALQFGADLETIKQALTKDHDGGPATPLGAALEGPMSLDVIIGIDIGIAGGVAVLSASGVLIEVHAMPCLADGPAGRRTVNGPLLASIVFASHATRAFVEYVSARPGEGAVGAFAFGRSRGTSRAFWPPLASPANS